jgi:cytochrome c
MSRHAASGRVRRLDRVASFGLLWAACAVALPAHAADAERAQALAKQSNCFKCHMVDQKKESTPWREIASKYRGKPDAEAKLTHHLTSGEKVKFEDGHEENHKIVKTKDPVEIKNLVDWILSL